MLIINVNNTHYCYIKSLSKLLHSNHRTEKVLTDHTFYCHGIKHQVIKIEMPKEGEDMMHSENHQNQMKAPYIIYADFKSIITKLHTCSFNPVISGTNKTKVHGPCSFGYTVVRSDAKTYGPFVYRGAVEVLLKCLLTVERLISEGPKVKKTSCLTRKLEKGQQGNEMPHLPKRPNQTELQRYGCDL